MNDRARRGLVPLVPLALILLFPCYLAASNEMARTGTEGRPWCATMVGAAVVLAFGVLLGGAGVVVARRVGFAHRLAGPVEVASIVLVIAGGCAVLHEGDRRDLLRRDVRLVWSERESAEAMVSYARMAGKPVIVNFTARWSYPVIAFDEDTPEHALLRAEAARFVTVHIDATNDDEEIVRELERRFRVVGLPEVVVLDGEGNEAARIVSYSSATHVRAVLEAVR